MDERLRVLQCVFAFEDGLNDDRVERLVRLVEVWILERIVVVWVVGFKAGW